MCPKPQKFVVDHVAFSAFHFSFTRYFTDTKYTVRDDKMTLSMGKINK